MTDYDEDDDDVDDHEVSIELVVREEVEMRKGAAGESIFSAETRREPLLLADA